MANYFTMLMILAVWIHITRDTLWITFSAIISAFIITIFWEKENDVE